MSKRAEELAKQLYPDPKLEDYDDILVYRADRDNAIMGRSNVICVYEQAEKETFNRVSDWLRENLYMYLYVCNGEPGLPLYAVIEAMRESIMEEE